MFCAFSEKAGNEDLNKFFNENFYMIYGVFLDTFSAYENNCKKGAYLENSHGQWSAKKITLTGSALCRKTLGHRSDRHHGSAA